MNSKSEEKLSQTENEVKPILRSEWEKTHQTETLTWHKYPEAKPKEKGSYWVTLSDGSTTIAHWSMNTKRFSGLELGHKFYTKRMFGVIAWADPKGWNENKE